MYVWLLLGITQRHSTKYAIIVQLHSHSEHCLQGITVDKRWKFKSIQSLLCIYVMCASLQILVWGSIFYGRCVGINIVNATIFLRISLLFFICDDDNGTTFLHPFNLIVFINIIHANLIKLFCPMRLSVTFLNDDDTQINLTYADGDREMDPNL